MKPNSTVLFIVAAVMVFSNGASPSAFGQASDQKPQELSKNLDSNKDSKLSTDKTDEDRPATRSADSRKQNRNRPAGNRGFNPKQIAVSHFERLDRNQDGKLSLNEIPEPMRPRMKPLFERLGKEVLTQEDFVRAVASRFGPSQGRGRPEAGRGAEENRERESDRERGRRPGNRDGDRRPGERESRRGDRERGERPDESNRDRDRGERGPGGFGGPAFFRLLDENRDGQLSKNELAKAAEKLLELDRNKDGRLDLRELFGGGPQGFRGPFGLRSGFRPPFERRGDDPRPDFRSPFRRPGDGPPPDARRPNEASRERRRPGGSVQRSRGNSNRSRAGDAQRSRSRGRGLEGEAGRDPGSPGFVEGLLKRLDKNSDGKLSKVESSERLLEGFSRFDGNKDGSLDLEELRRAFSRRGERDAQRERPERNREAKEDE